MDYLQLLNNALPQATAARVGLLSAGLLISGYVASYPYSWIKWYRTDQYRLTVCWDHYTALDKASYNNNLSRSSVILTDQYLQTLAEYKDCLKSARKGTKIYPPSK